jgi:hypothetical protein
LFFFLFFFLLTPLAGVASSFWGFRADKFPIFPALSAVLVYISRLFPGFLLIKPQNEHFIMLPRLQKGQNQAKTADKSGIFPDLSAVQARIS